MIRNALHSMLFVSLAAWTVLGGHGDRAYAAGLNTDAALTPPKGGTIIRTQWRLSRLSNDPTPRKRTVHLSVQPVTVVHGVTEDLAVLATVPTIYRKVAFGSGRTVRDTGIGDIPLLAKYRFFQDDKPGVTTRWAAIGGVEVPTFDKPFSSRSFDPIVGTVWTHQRRAWWVDWDVLYQFNTAGGMQGDDRIRGDVAYSRRLIHGENDRTGPWGVYAVDEVNAQYLLDGSRRVSLSPGIQIITSRVILEAGIQLPVYQNMSSQRLENDYTAVVSLRFQF